MQIAANPIQHLKFVSVFGDLVFFDVNLAIFDDAFVVCGDAGVVAKLEVAVDQAAVLHVYGVLVWEGFALRLEVRAFDDAQVRFEIRETLEIGRASCRERVLMPV